MVFWGEKDSTISFCEGAYVKSDYIAEYYNSLTGLIYSLLGIYFLKTKLWRMSYTLIFLGIGTVLLHATQRWYGQYIDELSMLYLSFQIIEYLRMKQHKSTSQLWIPLGLSIYLHNYNLIFLFIFSACQAYILFYLKKPRPHMHCEITAAVYNYMYKYLFLFSLLLWLLDHIFCEHIQPYYLHAWWHIGTGLSIFFGLNELLLCE